jgi:hypothetical protein
MAPCLRHAGIRGQACPTRAGLRYICHFYGGLYYTKFRTKVIKRKGQKSAFLVILVVLGYFGHVDGYLLARS